MSEFACSSECGFTLDQLSARATVDTIEDAGLDISCPVCGSQLELRFASLGIVTRGKGPQTKYVRWNVGGAARASNRVEAGLFQLTFKSLGTIEPREICYPQVPAFQQEDGTVAVPTLPVQREFFDCVDTPRLEQMWKDGHRATVVGGEYHIDLPLYGLDDPFPIQLQLMTHRPSGERPKREFSGVSLRVWPNLPIAEWKHHLVGMSAVGEGSEYLLAPTPRVRLFTRGAEAEGWSRNSTSVQREGHAALVAADERPRWIDLEIGAEVKPFSDQDTLTGGGIFYVPPSNQTAAGEIEIGLDFGTSNTCLAIKGEILPGSRDRNHLLPVAPEEEWSFFLVRGGPEARDHVGPDLWPSPVGFGRKDDLYPSELLFSRKRVAQSQALVNIDQWRYGLDFGTPPADVRPEFLEADYLLGDFKWTHMLQRIAPSFAQKTAKLQAQYLAGILMNSYARIAAKWEQYPSSVKVYYSYPMSYQESDLATLEEAEGMATAILQEATGLDWQLSRGHDESTAAAASGGDPGATVAVYLDMGGGSTDIAVKLERKPDKWETVWANSVQYAGMSLLDAYCGEDEHKVTCCLAGSTTVDVLRRRVREAINVSEVFGDSTLFDTAKLAVTRNRTTHFYGYVVEYIARLLAAGFLDQRFKLEDQEGDRRFPDKLVIAMYLLGNGWRFDGWLFPDFHQALVDTVFKRMMQLVMEEKGEYAEEIRSQLANTKVRPRVKELQEIPHEKAAVAIGLLTEEARRQVPTTPAGGESGILGWTTTVNGNLEVPWFATYDRSGPNRPPAPTAGERTAEVEYSFGGSTETAADNGPETPWYQDLHNPSLDWDKTPPRFPTEIESPFDLDANLDRTRGTLRSRCADKGNRWFTKGPYEVLLEKLFASALRTIGG